MVITKMSDAFNGTTIDTGKWTKTDPDGYISQNNVLDIAQPHAKSTALFDDNLKSVASVTSSGNGQITVQCNLTWTTDSTLESSGGLFLYVDNNNFAQITGRTAAGGKYRLFIRQASTTAYDIDTSQVKGQDVKIEYDFTAHTIKFYFWGGSSWTQLGTTQTFNLGATAFIVFTAADSVSNTGANPYIYDNAYLVDGIYSTQFPPSINGMIGKFYGG